MRDPEIEDRSGRWGFDGKGAKMRGVRTQTRSSEICTAQCHKGWQDEFVPFVKQQRHTKTAEDNALSCPFTDVSLRQTFQ